jgi:predicted PurR-regulated permease PerM
MNESNTNAEIIVKLFDTLKDSSDRTSEALRNLISQQNDLITHVKQLPVSDLKQALKDHSDKTIDQFNSCNNSTERNTNSLLEKLRNIDNKMTKVLIVISVAFSLIAIAYFVVRSTTDTSKLTKEIIEQVEGNQDKKHNEIVEAIKKEIEKLHKK